MRVSIRFLLLLVLISPTSRAEAKPKVAVMTLEDGTRALSGQVVDALTDALRTELARSGRYIVIDKSRQAAALKRLVLEQKKESYRECYDSSCQIPLGQALAADSILRTKLTRVGSTYLLLAEQVDLAKEAVTAAAQARVPVRPARGRDDRLLGAVSTLVRQLTGLERRGGGGLGVGTLGRGGSSVTLRMLGTRGRGGGGGFVAHGGRVAPTPEEMERQVRLQREQHRKAEEQRAQRRAEYLQRQEERKAERARQREERERQYRIRKARVDLERSRRARLAWGWIGIVTGGILGATGAYLATAKVADDEDAADQATTPDALKTAADDASRHRTSGIVLGGIGAAAAGLGLYLVLTAPKLTPLRVSDGGLELERVPRASITAKGGFALGWGGRF